MLVFLPAFLPSSSLNFAFIQHPCLTGVFLTMIYSSALPSSCPNIAFSFLPTDGGKHIVTQFSLISTLLPCHSPFFPPPSPQSCQAVG